ncbi:MAG: ABC transporter substrate-binding protein [Deltaproteobacteria bacterium]|nr:ABC transporter substrate-binding protein [Deltaproteobacteria bacterium]
MPRRVALLALLLAAALAAPATANPRVAVSHALAMHGDVKYKAGFKSFDYANPRAPKGGEVRLPGVQTFDSLNPFILKGIPAAGVGLLFDSLTVSSDDEPFTRYGLVAETIETPEDRSWVAFSLRKEARFHDGSPITPDDVIFSFEILKAKGHPRYRSYFGSVVRAEKVGERKVRFVFEAGQNRELPLIIGELPILSKDYWSGRTFDNTTLEAPLGSGPYRVESVDPGRSITYVRVKDYWGARLAVNAGRFNFDRIRYDYYRDPTVALEAFKAGNYDFRLENSSKDWATGYDCPALRQGLIKREEIPNQMPTGMQGFVFNTRRPVFQDRRVREALAYAFDYEWSNRSLFYGAYTRTRSYFSNSELASSGLPGREEREILNGYKGRIPEEVLTREFRPPATDGTGNIRDNLKKALVLLGQAGWRIQNERLVNSRTGQPMEFQILLDNPQFERISLPFVRNLERLGIKATVRTVDAAQYQNRLDRFDFDMIVAVFGESLSPGNEQRDFWGSDKANLTGSQNLAGVRDKVVDELVNLVISAPDRRSLVFRTRALDRVLLWGFYVIPHWHIRSFRVAYWDRFSRPQIPPKYALDFEDTWWIDPAKDAALGRRKAAGAR